MVISNTNLSFSQQFAHTHLDAPHLHAPPHLQQLWQQEVSYSKSTRPSSMLSLMESKSTCVLPINQLVFYLEPVKSSLDGSHQVRITFRKCRNFLAFCFFWALKRTVLSAGVRLFSTKLELAVLVFKSAMRYDYNELMHKSLLFVQAQRSGRQSMVR